ncbi:MAG TPA: hypothetical protein VMU94_07780, partial [Streptosporangiaceae bacterium]|nr:hypothetical protein [Streptosporangiaceae bacterium]
APLLRQVSRTRVLATSRERLRLSLEHVMAVRPLAVPSESAVDDLTALAQVPSVALLLERAAVRQPELRLNVHNAAAIARICRQMEGLLLALEVAAARLRDVEPQDLALRRGWSRRISCGRLGVPTAAKASPCSTASASSLSSSLTDPANGGSSGCVIAITTRRSPPSSRQGWPPSTREPASSGW